ncbi:MAG: serine/threonine-protein kinase, partial [Polyangiaceae bacterium]
VLVRLHAALSQIAEAGSLQALAPSGGSEPEVISSLETALGSLAQIAVGARGRLDPDRVSPVPSAAARPLTVAVARVLSGADAGLSAQVIASALDDLLAGIPRAIGQLVSEVVWRLTDLPRIGAASLIAGSMRMSEALPAWLPACRTIGGFYVHRALSAGAVGSVFVATRSDEKGDADAERFALKVPEYSAGAARSLSEAEFLRLFRDEASALMAVPAHPNLARFVTFDAGSKPKPILVMELVEGATLEHILEARGIDMPRALSVLSDVLCGLEAMHAVGVGHLDVKPSNVVLRRGEQGVLVDFGLAGRHIRPGCATGPYGAPEVWGAFEGRRDLSPTQSDVYAFGCVAFEALTGKVLFEADTEMGQIAQHVSHDGAPPLLSALAKRRELAGLAALLTSTLRRNPDDRPTVKRVRAELSRISPPLAAVGWPIAIR